MFVFKATVVGAGTMGGQIAQTIAAAGIPVVLKDVEDDLVEAGLAEAQKVTTSQVGKLVEKGRLNEESAGAQIAAVVNRILMSALSEVWRMQEEQHLSIQKIDQAVTESKTSPMGPFYLGDLLGLDTVLHVAEYLDASYPGRMHVHSGLRELVAAGKLGAKTGGEGFYRDGQAQLPGEGEPDPQELADRFNLKALVEACLLVEEDVVSTKDADLGMMAGAGLMPPPFARADATGLDEVVRKLEHAASRWGERFEPPLLLRRLVKQGRTGLQSGQGFFAYKRPDQGLEQGQTVTLETRGDVAIAWLDNPPMNALSPAVIEDPPRVWDHVRDGGAVPALIVASANPQVFCAGADIRSFTQLDESTGRAFIAQVHALLRDMERSGVA